MKRFFCGLLLVGLFSGADAPPAVYVLSQGETFAEIAKKTLGDAAAVTELQHFNKWRSLPAPKAGMRIAIPGVEREAAITALGLAKIEIDAAKAVGAETYAAAELATARATLVRANATRSHGGYTTCHQSSQASSLPSRHRPIPSKRARLHSGRRDRLLAHWCGEHSQRRRLRARQVGPANRQQPLYRDPKAGLQSISLRLGRT